MNTTRHLYVFDNVFVNVTRHLYVFDNGCRIGSRNVRNNKILKSFEKIWMIVQLNYHIFLVQKYQVVLCPLFCFLSGDEQCNTTGCIKKTEQT